MTEQKTIAAYYKEDHDRLDELFKTFQTLKRSDFTKAMEAFKEFKVGLQRHILWEEELLFPLWEEKTGMIENGPTPVMRYEHNRIRQLLDAIHQRVEGLNPETDQDEQALINLLSSHNRKEERALYPAIDNVTNADERATILSNMNSIRKTGTMPAVVNTDGIRREGRGNMRGILSHFTLSLLALFGLLFAGWLGIETVSGANSARAESGQSPPDGKLKGNVLRGRDIFNGKGVCYYCHGIDGYIGRPPRLSADTAALIAKLNPPPSDLRNPDELRLKADKERALAIREGHPGTGMFPDHTMTDQDLADLLLYLALIRKDPHPEQ